MAIFDVSSMGESRSLPCRVGWQRCYGRPRWRAYLIIRERHTTRALVAGDLLDGHHGDQFRSKGARLKYSRKKEFEPGPFNLFGYLLPYFLKDLS
jgi:hypothetical protein